jgi:DNA-binding transcriptional LysR family regulator
MFLPPYPAGMQDHDWNDLKYVLALHRSCTLAGAGRVLGVNETTVARRLKAIERSLQTRLFVRNKTGSYQATEVGLAILEKTQRIERENASIGDVVGRFQNMLFGVVRITSVPMVVNRVLVPCLSAFRKVNPGVTIELVPESRNLSLSKREADLAVRLARPPAGGLRTMARKIGDLAFAVYCPVFVSDEDSNSLEWIGYDDAHSHLPQARWLAEADRGTEPALPCLRVCDAETAMEAVAAGLGRTILPRKVADTDLRLRRVSSAKTTDLPAREVWLLSHVDQSAHSSVVAAKEWLAAIEWSNRD